MREVLLYYGVFVMCYNVTVNSIYFMIMLFSFSKIGTIARDSVYTTYQRFTGSTQVPPISILVPAYNEEVTIVESIKSLLQLNYPTYEVIVINDGSKDQTLQVLISEFQLSYAEYRSTRTTLPCGQMKGVYHNPKYPKLYVIDKANSGKAGSLNVGMNFSHYPLVSSIDADSLLEKDALIRIAKVYLENPDETVAVGGNIRIANGCTIENGVVKEVRLPRKILPMFQAMEYLSAFLSGRIGWSAVNGLIIISGAFGVFRKDYLFKIGGYREGYPGEDMNIVLKLHKYMLDHKLPYRIAFCPDAVCWTQAPDTLRVLGSQRRRWGRGNVKNMTEIGFEMLFRPRYKTIGLLTIPYNIFFETFNPYFHLTGFLALIVYSLLDMTQIHVLLLFYLITFLSGYLLTTGSLLLEEIAFNRYPKISDIFKMTFYAVLMFFGYRQLNVFWRLLGHYDYLRKQDNWGTMTRTNWNQ